jgi:hypothetical protein
MKKKVLTWKQMIKKINELYEEPIITKTYNQEKFFRLCDLMGVCSGKNLLWDKWKSYTGSLNPDSYVKECMETDDELKRLNYNANLTKQIRKLSWIYNYGVVDQHPCISCEIGKKEMLYLHEKIWAGGHIMARTEKGTHNPFINIVPICTSCNTYMGKRHMAEYIKNPKSGKLYPTRDLDVDLQLDRNTSMKQFNCKTLVELYRLIYNTYLDFGFKGIYDLIKNDS